MNPEAVKALFEKFGMEDVPEDKLEPGTYTNMQLAEKLGLEKLEFALGQLPRGDHASNRSILSFMADM